MTAPSSTPLAIEFANTWRAERGKVREGLATPALLDAWLRAGSSGFAETDGPGPPGSIGPGPVGSDETGLAAFVALRDTIRGLLRATVDREPLDPALVAALNAAAATAPSWPSLRLGAPVPTVVQRTREPFAAAALGAIARDAVRLLGDGAAEDVRACQAPGCVQYFVKDRPRREWCCLACGNRARVARHQLRHQER